MSGMWDEVNIGVTGWVSEVSTGVTVLLSQMDEVSIGMTGWVSWWDKVSTGVTVWLSHGWMR